GADDDWGSGAACPEVLNRSEAWLGARGGVRNFPVGLLQTSPIPTALPVPLGPRKRHLEVFRRGCELGPAVWLGRNAKSDAAVLADERTTRATSPKTRVVHQEIIELALQTNGAPPGAANAHRFRVHPQIRAGHRVVDPSGKE